MYTEFLFLLISPQSLGRLSPLSDLGRSGVPPRMKLMTFQSFFWDTGALTLHDNCVGLRVGTQETLAEHRLLKEWNPPQKLEII